jgi:hypothetical protein
MRCTRSAYIKIHPIKVTVKKALDYITNPDKTDDQLLVSSFACTPETADLEFAMTQEAAKNDVMDKGNNLAFHLIQSFKPGEVDAKTAHLIGKRFANEVLKGKYEYVISALARGLCPKRMNVIKRYRRKR